MKFFFDTGKKSARCQKNEKKSSLSEIVIDDFEATSSVSVSASASVTSFHRNRIRSRICSGAFVAKDNFAPQIISAGCDPFFAGFVARRC